MSYTIVWVMLAHFLMGPMEEPKVMIVNYYNSEQECYEAAAEGLDDLGELQKGEFVEPTCMPVHGMIT